MADPQAQPTEPFAWSKKRITAAMLLAEDVLTDKEIAAHPDVGIHDRTLRAWKQHPAFRARMAENLAELQERARSSGLGRIDVRMARYQRRAELLDLIQQERAEDMQDVPGGKSGFLVRQIKIVSSGEGSYTVDQYAFDHQLHREMRELEKQAAQDAGDWSEKQEVSGPGGEPLTIVFRQREDGPQ